MIRNLRAIWVGACGLMLIAACARHETRAPSGLSFDEKSQRFAVHVVDVPRDELLDQLRRMVGIEVRPRPPGEERLTMDADDLDADELIARLLPVDHRYVVRRGEREIAVRAPGQGDRKVGPAPETTVGLPTKGRPGTTSSMAGPLKRAASASDAAVPTQVQGPMTKAPAATLLASEGRGAKKPLPMRISRQTVRVTLAFEEGKAPQILAVQSIEGRAPVERFVRGPFLYVLADAQGRFVGYGSFEDPLEIHSYLPEGPHSTGREKSGLAGISLDRERIGASTLHVIDARGLTLPRELTDEVVRGVMARSKPLLVVPTSQLLRALEREDIK